MKVRWFKNIWQCQQTWDSSQQTCGEHAPWGTGAGISTFFIGFEAAQSFRQPGASLLEGLCWRRFCLLGGCPLLELQLPGGVLLFASRPPFAEPCTCRAASAQRKHAFQFSPKVCLGCSLQLSWQGNMGNGGRSHSKHPPSTPQMEFCFWKVKEGSGNVFFPFNYCPEWCRPKPVMLKATWPRSPGPSAVLVLWRVADKDFGRSSIPEWQLWQPSCDSEAFVHLKNHLLDSFRLRKEAE